MPVLKLHFLRYRLFRCNLINNHLHALLKNQPILNLLSLIHIGMLFAYYWHMALRY